MPQDAIFALWFVACTITLVPFIALLVYLHSMYDAKRKHDNYLAHLQSLGDEPEA